MKIFVLMENSYDYHKFPHLVKASTEISNLFEEAKKINPKTPVFMREDITTEMETELSIKETVHFEIVTFDEKVNFSPNSENQFTGKLDDFGNKIYKGDKVRIDIKTPSKIISQECEVVFEDYGFKYKHTNGSFTTLRGLANNCTVTKIENE